MCTYTVHTHLNSIVNASVPKATVAKEVIFLLFLLFFVLCSFKSEKCQNCHYIKTNLLKSSHYLLFAVPLSSLSFSVVFKGTSQQFFLLLDADGSLIPSSSERFRPELFQVDEQDFTLHISAMRPHWKFRRSE